MYVERLNPDTPVSQDDADRMSEMHRVLRPDAPDMTIQRIMLVARMHTVFLVRDERDRVVGMAILVVIHDWGVTKGDVEGVVRAKDAVGHGIGTMLMDELHQAARDRGCVQIELTSHPTRIRANQLYRRLGYAIRETNPYRLKL